MQPIQVLARDGVSRLAKELQSGKKPQAINEELPINRSVISKWLGASILAVGLAVTSAPLSATAQDSSPAPGTSPSQENPATDNAPNIDTTPFQEARGNVDNYGWLGLLGLVGLLNLFRKPEAPPAYREPTTGRTSDRL